MNREERYEGYMGFFYQVGGILRAKTDKLSKLETIEEFHTKLKAKLKAGEAKEAMKRVPTE